MIDLAAMPVLSRVLTGESLPVRAIVTNSGDRPAAIPALTDPSPYSYELTSEMPEGPRYVVSAAHLAITLAGDPTSRSIPAPPDMLAPGGRAHREEDVAMLSEAPFVPGRYGLSARWDGIASFPAPVEVAAPNPAAFASGVSRRLLAVASVLAHTEPDGATVILERESFTGNPRFGVFYRRAHLAPGTRVDDVSVALDAQAGGSGRWAAWLQNGSIAAVKGFGETALHTAAPVATELREARFAGAGVQLGDGAALFLVAGVGPSGPRLAQYSATRAGLKRPWAADFSSALPPRLATRYSMATIDVVWVEAAGGGARLWVRSFNWRGAGQAPRLLSEFPGAVQAWELDAAAGRSVYLITGPVEGRMRLLRAPLDAGQEPLALDFAAPQAGAEAWAISVSDEGGFPVLARSEGRIVMLRAASGGAWSVVAENAASATRLQLFTLKSRPFWAQWFDPERGFQLREIR